MHSNTLKIIRSHLAANPTLSNALHDYFRSAKESAYALTGRVTDVADLNRIIGKAEGIDHVYKTFMVLPNEPSVKGDNRPAQE